MSEERTEITYEFNNIYHTIIGSSDLHFQLQNNSKFSEEYFKGIFLENTSSGATTKRKYSEGNSVSQEYQCQGKKKVNDSSISASLLSTPSASLGSSSTSCSNTAEEEFRWTRQSILFLLNMYKEKTELFRNSKIKNKDIWFQILKEFKNKGYKCITIEILDRKMRNLKKTYKDNKDKKNKTGEGTITWEYFDVMDQIFFNDKTINPTSTISTMELVPEDTLKEIEPIPVTSNTDTTATFVIPKNGAKLRTEVSSNQKQQAVTLGGNMKQERVKTIKAKRIKQLYDHRKKIQEIETGRLEEVRKLRESIEENNRIQQERNDILRLIANSK